MQGVLPGPGGSSIPIWHFQDDAVTGSVRVIRNPNEPMSIIMPRIIQDGYQPTRYQIPWDGPDSIARFSKDLAFELYTIPEPGGLLLIVLAAFGLAAHRRR
jgi:hypothetical protein